MNRRGLTLLEVLAAIVMLALLATVATPLYRDALRSIRGPATTTTDTMELARLAEIYLADPESVEAKVDSAGRIALPWPDDSERDPAQVTRMTPVGGEDGDAARIWFSFAWDGQIVHRCVITEVDAR